MAQYTFDEIKIFNDTMDDMEIIRTMTRKDPERAFYIADIGNVIEKHQGCWITKMPRVVPHFAIKCNPDPTVIKVLAASNVGFVIVHLRNRASNATRSVHGSRIIFPHPTKYLSHIKYSKKKGVEQMTADSESELFKIKDIFPEAKIIIRIRCDSKNTSVILGLKFGIEPDEETVRLIQLAKQLDLNLHGFSFHVDSPCGEMEAYGRGIELCKQLINTSKAIGHDNVQLIDIGGEFPGETGTNFATIINDAIQDLDPSIKVISEPGSYYVSSSFTLTAYMHSKRIIPKNDGTMRMYYMNCGVFSSFIDELLGLQARLSILLSEPTSDEKFLSSLWGPTADSHDLIVKQVMLPELHIGDWLVWKDMGYTIALATTFNGFPIPIVIPIIRKSQWENFKAQIDSM